MFFGVHLLGNKKMPMISTGIRLKAKKPIAKFLDLFIFFIGRPSRRQSQHFRSYFRNLVNSPRRWGLSNYDTKSIGRLPV